MVVSLRASGGTDNELRHKPAALNSRVLTEIVAPKWRAFV